jgi:citrate synthase
MSATPTPAFSPGLKDVIADESSICEMDENAGLHYRGYEVHELASHKSFEDVAYLILYGELPTPAQSKQFLAELTAEQTVPPQVLAMLRLVPPAGHPIDALRTAVSMLAMFDPEVQDNSPAANLRKSVRLLSKVTTLTTSAWRLSHGQEPPPPPKTDLPLGGRLVYGLTGKPPEKWQIDAFNTIFILYAEHEFNASTFAARVTASTLADMYAAVTSALGALKGPLHGGANEDAMKVLEDIGSPQRVESWVEERLARKEKISGIGHRVYRSGDSRVPAMRGLAIELAERFGKQNMVAICQELEAVMARRKNLCANLDLYAAPVLAMLDIPVPLNTPIFACSRIVGWCAHVCEQHAHNRLIRPRCIYKGVPPRKLG